MRALGFLGRSRLDAARDRLPAAIEQWRAQWCFVDEQQPCAVECLEEAAAPERDWQPLQWHLAEAAAGALWLAGNHETAWRQMVFGPHAQSVPDDGTAAHLLHQARLALANVLLEALAVAPVTELSQGRPEHPGAPLGSRVFLRVAVEGCECYCLLDASLLDGFLPKPAERPSLTARQQAIGRARVKLQVNLPLANLAVGDLDDLRPGDVLRARTELTQPLSLATERADIVAKGYLARSDQALALQLIN